MQSGPHDWSKGTVTAGRVERLRAVFADAADRGRNTARNTSTRHRRLLVGVVVALCFPAPFIAVSDAAVSRPADFHWFAAAPAPASWSHHALPPRDGILSYPAHFVVGNDKDGVARERLDRHGSVLVYLDLSHKEGPERVSTWPSYRLGLVRGESDDVHEDGHAIGLRFTGGRGSCVLDDYRTRVENHHYREIACFVKGRRHASVLIAAALESAWTHAVKTLERAVDAYRAT
jgi:hypothetical protein